MKKKSLLATGVALCMIVGMSSTVFAANVDTNVNNDGTAVTAPGSPAYDKNNGGNTQTAGQSFNEAIMESLNGTDFNTTNDDDAEAKDTDINGADINVWAKVTDSGSKIYKVDLAWGAMKFEFNSGSGQWNTTTHAYDNVGGGVAEWTASYLDGTNNKVAVTNHSNNAIDANFAYTMDLGVFNDANGTDNVIGNFFADNTKAAAAATVFTGTYSDTAGTVNDAAIADKLLGSKVAIATADAYNSTAGDGTVSDATNNQLAGARNGEVFFAFSGTPDAGKGATLDSFKKVGVITVTVTPNNDIPLNRPAYK